MPKLIVGLAAAFIFVDSAMAANISARWIGSCSYLLSNQTGNNLSLAQNYCNNVGVSSSYCSTNGSGLSGNSTYKYCSGSKWYSNSGLAEYVGTGVFCFQSVADCTTAMGLSGGNTHNNTKTERNKGILIDSYYEDSLYGGMQKVGLYVLNTAFFECIKSCANYSANWVSVDSYCEASQKQYCLSDGECREEMSTGTAQVRCRAGYYDASGKGYGTGFANCYLQCTPCPTKDGVPDEYITTQYTGVANLDYGCVISANKDIEDISGTYSFEYDCPYAGDGS